MEEKRQDNQPDRRQDGRELSEAAQILGISQEAVRKRLQRKTLEGYKVDDRWFVVLPEEQTASGHYPDTHQDAIQTRQDARQDSSQDGALAAEIERLREELAKARTEAAVAQAEIRRLESHVGDLREHLQEQRADRREEIKRRDTLLLDLQKRLPELPAPDGEMVTEGKKRRWWLWSR